VFIFENPYWRLSSIIDVVLPEYIGPIIRLKYPVLFTGFKVDVDEDEAAVAAIVADVVKSIVIVSYIDVFGIVV
jgi:hypothetical protein